MNKRLSLIVILLVVCIFGLTIIGCSTSSNSDSTSNISCSLNTQCPSTEICLKSICQTALNRVYRLIVKSASLNYTLNSTDYDLSYPDPYVTVYFPDRNTYIGTTYYINDTLTPEWNQSFDITVTSGEQLLKFCILDEDLHDSPIPSLDDPLYFFGTNNANGDYCMYTNDIIPDLIKPGEVAVTFPGPTDVNYLIISISPK